MSLEQLLAWIPPGSADETLARQVNFERLPVHVAIIMDGNGRWAAQRHLPRVEGHRAGIASVRDVVETSARLGIDVLTLYAFSVENWKRPRTEINTLMILLKRYLRLELSTLLRNNIRFQVIGRPEELPTDVQHELDIGIRQTDGNTGMRFNIALNYGGRAEIVDAARRAIAAGIPASELDEQRFGDLLYTAGQPDPDLLIRTSGEMRVSNFLLWQIAYSEIWVTETLWPDFRRRHLLEAIVAYQKRDRRYGGIQTSPVAAIFKVTRVLSGAALIALAIVVVWSNQRIVFETTAFVLLVAATYELITLFRAGGIAVPRRPVMIASLLTLATFSGILAANVPVLTTDAVLMVALIGLSLVAMRTWRGGADALATVSASLFPSLYVALPIGAMLAIREQGPRPLFLLMLTVIVSDTAQYYTGRLAGRHLLAPTISPKKTIEGAMGGLVFGTALFAAVGAWWLPEVPVGARIGIGVGVVAVGISGDLFESMLKRSAGVKDSSAIIPGHGGVLDRIDALLFAAPFFYVAGHFIRV